MCRQLPLDLLAKKPSGNWRLSLTLLEVLDCVLEYEKALSRN